MKKYPILFIVKIFSIEGKQQVITQQIQDFNDAYLEARNQRLELDSKIAELRRIYTKKNEPCRSAAAG